MRAVVYKDRLDITIEDRSDPRVEDGADVVVRVHSTGICGTDRNIFLGRFPARPGVILGHESVGTVESIGPHVRDLKVGDRVVINPTLYCGRCHYCRRGAFNFCDNKTGTEVGVDRDGTFAQFAALPDTFLHKIPDDIPFDRAVFIEPLACILNNIEAADLRPHDEVVVLGSGPIGTIFAMVAQKVAYRVVVVESDPYRLSLARGRFKHVVDSARGPFQEAAIDASGGRKPRVVVDTTGLMLDESVDLVAKGGRIIPMGFNSSARANFKVLYVVNNGISIIGAGDYNAPIFPAAIDLAAELPLDELITHRFPLEGYREAFELLSTSGAAEAAGYGAMKVLIDSE